MTYHSCSAASIDCGPGGGNGSVLAWRTPWTEEPGALQPVGLQRLGRNWLSTSTVDWMRTAHLTPWRGPVPAAVQLLFLFSLRSIHTFFSAFSLWFPSLCLCLVTQSCPTLCNPMDSSPPGSSVHGILQAKILEWVAFLFSRGSSQPRDRTQVSRIAGDSLSSEPPGKAFPH